MRTSSADPTPKRDCHGVLLLDKDRGQSSNSALQQAKRLLGVRKAGHTGSLDPLASGLLPICLGEATKFAGFLLETDKRYQVSVRLGETTDTGDAEGEILDRRPVPPLSARSIEAILQCFRGRINQIPPMYSALKHHGHRLYDLARRGIEVERASREVDIFELRLLDFDSERLDLEVHCSKGTYIRSLAEDLGRAFGCGAHVTRLRRTAVGSFSIAGAHTLQQLEALPPEARAGLVAPPDSLVQSLPKLRLDQASCARLRHGQRVGCPPGTTPGLLRLYDTRDDFIGLGEVAEPGRLAPRRLIGAAEDDRTPVASAGAESPRPEPTSGLSVRQPCSGGN